MTRIETFTDAAFAFTLTLLVVSFDMMPSSFGELVNEMREIPAFLMSSALILMFWYGHLVWSRRYGLQDGPTILLSFLLVITVLVYVYPLRFMTGVITLLLSHLFGISWIGSDIDFPAVSEVNELCIIYGIGFTVMCLCISLLNLRALQMKDQLELNALEVFDTVWDYRGWLIVGSTGVLSVILSLLLPADRTPGIPAFTYMLLPIIMPIFGYKTEKARRRLRERTGL